MDTAKIYKRVLIYLFDLLICVIAPMIITLPFFLAGSMKLSSFFLFSFLGTVVIYPLYELLFLYFSTGYTLFSLIFGVKYVCLNEQKISFKQCLLRVLYEFVIIFPIVDVFFCLHYKTRRGAIDRLSDTFAVDVRKN